jgi:hypothetical protein
MSNIYTFGDGFATGHIWPEWPQILQALLPEHNVINTSAVGAGAEWLVHRFVQLLPTIDGTVIFQWPQANRFDKLLEDPNWTEIANNDPVYNFNQYTYNDETWWLSSASTHPLVTSYHREFVQENQAAARISDYKVLVSHSLPSKKCRYVEVDTRSQDIFSNDKKYIQLRQTEVQPSPLVHYDWLIEVVLPATTLVYDKTRAASLRNLIQCQEWIPFYYDRQLVWDSLLTKLNNSNN